MKEDVTIYVRDKTTTPVGVVYFKKTGTEYNGMPVVAMGWSKACKTDQFIKKIGRSVAINRANKCIKINAAVEIDDESIVSLDHTVFRSLSTTIPFVIKKRMSYFLDVAKDGLDIKGDAIIIAPVIDKFVDIAEPLKKAIANDLKVFIAHNSKVTVRTRYITLKY